MSDDLYDPYEDAGSGSGGAPVISWKYSRPGDAFTGVVIPPLPLERPEKGYKMGREYQNGTDSDPDDKGFLVWPPKNNREKIKRPVTEGRFAELWPDEEMPTGRGRVSRVEVTFATDYAAGEFFSDTMKDRYEDDEKDPKDEKHRRVVVSSADLRAKVDEALKAYGGKPQPGQRWTVTLSKREPNVGRQGTTSRYTVSIQEPTAETKAIVQAHIDAAKASANAAADAEEDAGLNPPF